MLALDEDFEDVRARLSAPPAPVVEAAPPISNQVREARRKAGSTQRELAARAGVAQCTIAAIEVGANGMARASTLEKIMRACKGADPK